MNDLKKLQKQIDRATVTETELEEATKSGSKELPVASATTLGGVKVGENLSIDGNGVLSAQGESYELPIASAEVLGGIKVGSNLSITEEGVLSAQGGGSTEPLVVAGTISGDELFIIDPNTISPSGIVSAFLAGRIVLLSDSESDDVEMVIRLQDAAIMSKSWTIEY